MSNLHPGDLKKIRILHLEDITSDAELVAKSLEREHISFETLVVRNKAAFIKALKKFAFDIILSDHSLASFDSHEALRMVQAAGIKVPFILVTATMSDEFAAKIIRDGASDYIIKDRLHRLPSAVINSIEKNIARDKQKATQELSLQSEKRFRALIEKSTDMLTLSDENGNMLYGSPSITTIFGYSPEEFLNKSGIEFIHPDDIDNFIKNKISVFATPGKSLYSQQRLRHKNGNWLWCEGTDTNMLHEPGIQAIVSNFRDITDKKMAEERLIKSEAFNLGVINSLSSHIAVIDEFGNIVAVNSAWKRYASENGEATLINTGIGSNYFNACANSSKTGETIANEAFCGIMDVINGNKNDFYLEYPCHSPDSQQWFGMTVIKFESDEKMVVVSHQNITERKLAEKRVADSEKKYRQIVETAQEGIWLIDADNLTIFVNKRMCEMLEYTEQEMLGRSILSFKDEKGQQAGARNIEKRKLGIKETYESEFIAKSGKYVLTLLSGNPVLDDNGNYNGALAMISDITDRKKTALKLAQSEIRLNEAQAIAHMGNFEVDMQNYSEVWSDEMYKIYGVNKEDVIPSKELFLSFIHPDDVDEVIAKMDNSIKTYETSVANFRFIRADGALRYGYSEARFEFDKNRQLIRTYGIFQDVTETKLAELERKKIVSDLMLRNTELEQFAFIISHNLRAPVANIIGAANTLNDGDLSLEDTAMLTRGIGTSATKLDEVIKDLNQILEVKTEMNTTKELVRFSKLTEHIITSIKGLIGNDNIEINYDFSAVDELFTLRPYLYSVFYNLITNSVRYRRKDVQSIIEIKSSLVENTIVLTFTDNGTGIDMVKNGDQVFGLYMRFHTNIDGKGMGLFMVKTQVQALGGKISVTSAKDAGTEFRIEFER